MSMRFCRPRSPESNWTARDGTPSVEAEKGHERRVGGAVDRGRGQADEQRAVAQAGGLRPFRPRNDADVEFDARGGLTDHGTVVLVVSRWCGDIPLLADDG